MTTLRSLLRTSAAIAALIAAIPSLAFAQSVQIGPGASATGTNALAAGTNANASGAATVAVGTGATSSGAGSTSVGVSSQAAGDYASTFGTGATAPGYGGVAVGAGAQASGLYGNASGVNASASGNYSSATGAAAQATGYASTANGYNARATADYTSTFGGNSIASGTASPSTGYDAQAKAATALQMVSIRLPRPPIQGVVVDQGNRIGPLETGFDGLKGEVAALGGRVGALKSKTRDLTKGLRGSHGDAGTYNPSRQVVRLRDGSLDLRRRTRCRRIAGLQDRPHLVDQCRCWCLLPRRLGRCMGWRPRGVVRLGYFRDDIGLGRGSEKMRVNPSIFLSTAKGLLRSWHDQAASGGTFCRPLGLQQSVRAICISAGCLHIWRARL